jgi:hypothetical protein
VIALGNHPARDQRSYQPLRVCVLEFRGNDPGQR